MLASAKGNIPARTYREAILISVSVLINMKFLGMRVCC